MEKYIRTIQTVRGSFLTLRVDEVELADGRKAKRDLIVHCGAVAVVALTLDNKLLLVEQYRHAVTDKILELPAGKKEKNEDSLKCAIRELKEETGYVAKKWQYLFSFYVSPGYTNEVIDLFLAEDLVPGRACPDEDEVIKIKKVPLKQLMPLLVQGKIKDAKTICGLLWLMVQKR